LRRRPVRIGLHPQPGSRLTAELPGARALAGDDGVKRAGTGVTMAEPVATSEDVIPLTDVMARWAYTEAVGAHSSTCYDGCAGIEALRAKRRAGVPFSELSTPERSVLFAAWYRVRSAFFGRYLGRVRGYRLAYWTRESLVSVRVPPGVDPQYTDHPRLAEFFSTEASDPRDPRNAHNEQGGRPSDDPLTLGLHDGDYVIGDGLHRGKTFLVACVPTSIAVYVPLPILAGDRR
jgi:hypothetical protein